MLRFDPGEDRIRSARSFRVSEGGGEYNVARNLAYAFQKRSGIVTALASNPVGRLAEELMRQGNVDVSQILWRKTDGTSGTSRNGLYFMESGFGLRPPTGCSDRANTAASQLKAGEIEWDAMFKDLGTRCFHTGGVFTALSNTTPDVAAEAMQVARDSGALVSYDLNYRESLWDGRGGLPAATRVNDRLLQYADVVFGLPGFDASLSEYTREAFAGAAAETMNRYPNLRLVASTLRRTKSASRHDVAGLCFAGGKVYESRVWNDVDVIDRVGSGDAFAAGFIFGVLEGNEVAEALEVAAVSSVLAMSTRGDYLNSTREEIIRLVTSPNVTPFR